MIEAPAWLEAQRLAASYLQPYIHQGYSRQPHITLATSGLMHQSAFNETALKQQIAVLSSQAGNGFSLSLGRLNSFAAAPYFEIIDAEKRLQALRQLLQSTLAEQLPQPYVPHLTVGLYRDAYPTREIAEKLNAFQHTDSGHIIVNELQFCCYETADIKGPLTVLHRLPLR